jgi:N-acetyl-anhydromuramyl-L-alanine amidase AmpD
VQNYIACVCLIRNGKPEPLIYNAGLSGARERTAWGIKPDGTHVFYVDKSSKTPEALQAFMLAQGCDSALMLDGGGSTQGIFPDGEVYSGRIVAHVICVWLDKPTEGKPTEFIIEPDYAWNGKLVPRTRTDYIILHHAAGDISPSNLHAYHVSLGWTGIGCNYYVRKDGNIYRGRPEEVAGAHTEGYNNKSIGICFEGNFEVENMSEKQLEAGIWLIKDILTRYNVPIAPHKNFANTACPGRNFPLARMMALATPTAPKTVTVELPMLRNGSKGASVKTIQRLLVVLGYNPGTADGDFGPRTEGAVKEFQRRNGLTSDGIVGQQTWNKILK